jgi:hypothetical protein
MSNRNGILKYSLVALFAATLAEAIPAEAASCPGPKVNWTSTSNAQCGFQANRGRSVGGTNTCVGCPVITFSLSANLFDGIHAFALGYTPSGIAMQNCFPFDDTENDGAVKVQGAGCLGGAKHNVVVIY